MKKKNTRIMLLMTISLVMSMYMGITAQAKSYKSLYKSFLAGNTQYSYYSVYNLDKKGDPELIAIKTGTPSTYHYFEVFTIKKNKVVSTGSAIYSGALTKKSGSPAICVSTKYNAIYDYQVHGVGYYPYIRLALYKIKSGKLTRVCEIYHESNKVSQTDIYKFAKGTKDLKAVSKKKWMSYRKSYCGTFVNSTGVYSKMKLVKAYANTSSNRTATFG